MVCVSYHDTVNELQGLRWAPGGPFARPEWFALLERVAPRPLYALAREGDAALCLPLLRRREGRIEALTNWYAFTYAPLHSGAEADPALAAALARDLARRAARVDLGKLAGEDGTSDALAAGFFAAGWRVILRQTDCNHILPVGGRCFATYLAARPGRLRTTLERKSRRLDLRLADRFDPADWAVYEAVYADSWKPAEGDPALLRAFAEAEGEAGRLRLGLAFHEGEAVAAQFWTVERGTAYIHKLAHRRSAQALSPGTVLTAALLRQAIDADGVALVDFGTGDDAYKADWMEARRPRFSLSALRASAPRNWPALAREAARALVRRPDAG